MNEPIKVYAPESRPTFEKWISERGGVLVWPNENLSNPDAGDVFTPARDSNGNSNANNKPRWDRGEPTLVTDIADFKFATMREVKRFRVGLRMGAQGMMVKLTDAATARVRKACADAGPESCYRFDYDTQEAVIEVPEW